jgi:hypothetical protein
MWLWQPVISSDSLPLSILLAGLVGGWVGYKQTVSELTREREALRRRWR